MAIQTTAEKNALATKYGTDAAFGALFTTAPGTALAAPTISLGATATTGGTFAAATYYWKLTATNAQGETVGSNELSAAIAVNGTQVINWTAIGGATGYKLYRGTAAGSENVLVATLGAVLTYTDTGAAGTAATVPASNTSGGANAQGTEVTGGSPAYARKALTWGAPSNGVVTASATFDVPACTVVGTGVFSAATAGNYIDGNTVTNVTFSTQDTVTVTFTFTQS